MTNRVEYQKHWALSEMLRRHQQSDDYCIVFEHHDDVMILDQETEPSTAAFYQVKTKNHGEWKLKELLRPDRAQDEDSFSIFGKMYLSKINFPKHTISLTFVSNVPCILHMANEDGSAAERDLLGVADINDDERREIIDQLRAEHGEAVTDGDADLFFVAHCDLALRNTEDHGVGRLERFLSTMFPHRKLQVRGIYHALLGEISRRTGHEDVPTSFDQLVRDRSLSRETVDRCLKDAGVHDDPDGAFDAMKNQMHAAGWGPGKVQQVSRAWHQYEVERMDPDNVLLRRLRHAIAQRVRDFVQPDEPPLETILVGSLNAVRREYQTDIDLLGEQYVRAMILFEYMEAYERNVPTLDSPTPEETA